MICPVIAVLLQRREISEGGVLESAAAGRFGIGAVGAGAAVGGVDALQIGLQRLGDLLLQRLARGVDSVDIDGCHALGDEILAGQRDGLGGEGLLQLVVAQDLADRIDEGGVDLHLVAALDGGGAAQQQVGRVLLAGFPARERVGVVRHEESELGAALAGLDVDRGREVAVEGEGARLRHADEAEFLLLLGEGQHTAG